MLFFLATLQSLVYYIVANECTDDKEAEFWVQGMGSRLNSHFKLFFFGLVIFLAGRIWVLFSIVSLAVAIPSLVVCVLIYLGVIYEQTKCVRALYQAKHDFWAGQRVEGDDARTA